jgi:hypothetical protein
MMRRRLATLTLLAGLCGTGGCNLLPTCPVFPCLRARIDAFCASGCRSSAAPACCDGPILDGGCDTCAPVMPGPGPAPIPMQPGMLPAPQLMPETRPPALATPPGPRSTTSRPIPYVPRP